MGKLDITKENHFKEFQRYLFGSFSIPKRKIRKSLENGYKADKLALYKDFLNIQDDFKKALIKEIIKYYKINNDI